MFWGKRSQTSLLLNVRPTSSAADPFGYPADCDEGRRRRPSAHVCVFLLDGCNAAPKRVLRLLEPRDERGRVALLAADAPRQIRLEQYFGFVDGLLRGGDFLGSLAVRQDPASTDRGAGHGGDAIEPGESGLLVAVETWAKGMAKIATLDLWRMASIPCKERRVGGMPPTSAHRVLGKAVEHVRRGAASSVPLASTCVGQRSAPLVPSENVNCSSGVSGSIVKEESRSRASATNAKSSRPMTAGASSRSGSFAFKTVDRLGCASLTTSSFCVFNSRSSGSSGARKWGGPTCLRAALARRRDRAPSRVRGE